MALTKPILYTPSAFDATQPYTFTFNVIGGDQVVANQLTITNQQTGVVVYQQKITTFGFSHTLPANTLTNGVYYSAYVITYNAANQPSTQSASVQFNCYSQPTWNISNMPVSGVINNSGYEFIATYNQIEDELLSSYSFILYDDERSQISTSGTLYVTSTALPITASHRFDGFEDNTTYYIRAIGKTVNGMNVDTGYIQFLVEYTTPEYFSDIELFNNCDGGYITVKSNLLSIDGISYPTPPIYAGDGTQVDASVDGRYVQWGQGFVINNNFTASLWGQSFNSGTQIIEFADDIGNILTVTYMHRSGNLYYLDMAIHDGDSVYHVYSDDETVWASFNKQHIWIRRNGEIYTIELHNLESEPISDTAELGIAILGWMILGRS